jgi:hypothetical protein
VQKDLMLTTIMCREATFDAIVNLRNLMKIVSHIINWRRNLKMLCY